ncbi:hypothetical protein ZWY2020_031858 [Hordeum vulgare]|nr:hypothetical protein ZWY2020_031858 [Hordeum vulgare]
MALRRSPRLHPQTPVSGVGAGATRRRSSRLNPQIPIGEEGAGVTTRRRSTRLHPQVHASEEGGTVICLRRSPRLHPQTTSMESRCGRGRSVVTVLSHGSCRRPFKYKLFLRFLLRLRDRSERWTYWGNFIKGIIPIIVILSQVSMHQPFLVDAVELKCCKICRMAVWSHVVIYWSGPKGEVVKGCCCPYSLLSSLCSTNAVGTVYIGYVEKLAEHVH